ncbi:hypothetical protein EWZ64_01250 [Helicobacter pylori]|nr:hypothetical protein [Helicobacter pylori]
MGKCFFSLAFLFDFIIDYILVLYSSVAFLFLLFLVVLVWGFIVLFKGFCLLILFKFFYCF